MKQAIQLVIVQGYYIGKWTRKFGEHQAALACLAVGLILVALTPRQPPYGYVQARAERELAFRQQAGDTYANVISLPENAERGLWGVPWLVMALIPLSVGSGLIRPTLNTLMTKQVTAMEYGTVLGASAALVSGANAIAPLVAGFTFQTVSPSAPFLYGGLLMALLWVVSLVVLRGSQQPEPELEPSEVR